DAEAIGHQAIWGTGEHDAGGWCVAPGLLQERLACPVEIKLRLGRFLVVEGGLKLMDPFWIACQVIIDNAQFAMRKVVHEMQAVGAGAALVLLPLCQRRLEISDGLVPKLPGGVGGPALVVIPPASAPDLARRHTVLLPVFDIDLAPFYSAP